MTSQREQLQALIAEIDALLSKASPKLPWVAANETAEQRQVLGKAREYLQLLTETVALPGPLSELELASGPPPAAEQASASSVLQALLQEMQYLRSQMVQPLRSEIKTLQQERETLLQQVQQLERDRQQLQSNASLDYANLDQLFQALAERLEAQVKAQIDLSVQRLDTEISQTYLLSEPTISAPELGSQLPQLTPTQRLAQLKQIQQQSDELVLGLDQTLRSVFEALQQSVYSYQDSLTQGLDTMHTLGQQGEMMFKALINHLAQQMSQDVLAAVSLEPGRGRSELPAARQAGLSEGDPSTSAVDGEPLDPDWADLNDFDLDTDFDEDEEITLFQLDQELSQLQLDDPEVEAFPFEPDFEVVTAIQADSEAEGEATDASPLDPLQVLEQLDEAAASPEAWVEVPTGETTTAAATAAQPESAEALNSDRDQAIDELYETLFGEDAAPAELETPASSDELMAFAADVDSASALDLENQIAAAAIAQEILFEPADAWSEGKASAEPPLDEGSPIEPSNLEASTAEPDPVEPDPVQAELALDELLFETAPSQLEAAAAAIAPSNQAAPAAAPEAGTETTLETVFGETFVEPLQPVPVAVPETITSLAELLPDQPLEPRPSWADTPESPPGQPADDFNSSDDFIAAAEDEDLLTTDDSTPADYGLVLGEATLEQLSADLSQLETGLAPDSPNLAVPAEQPSWLAPPEQAWSPTAGLSETAAQLDLQPPSPEAQETAPPASATEVAGIDSPDPTAPYAPNPDIDLFGSLDDSAFDFSQAERQAAESSREIESALLLDLPHSIEPDPSLAADSGRDNDEALPPAQRPITPAEIGPVTALELDLEAGSDAESELEPAVLPAMQAAEQLSAALAEPEESSGWSGEANSADPLQIEVLPEVFTDEARDRASSLSPETSLAVELTELDLDLELGSDLDLTLAGINLNLAAPNPPLANPLKVETLADEGSDRADQQLARSELQEIVAALGAAEAEDAISESGLTLEDLMTEDSLADPLAQDQPSWAELPVAPPLEAPLSDAGPETGPETGPEHKPEVDAPLNLDTFIEELTLEGPLMTADTAPLSIFDLDTRPSPEAGPEIGSEIGPETGLESLWPESLWPEPLANTAAPPPPDLSLPSAAPASLEDLSLDLLGELNLSLDQSPLLNEPPEAAPDAPHPNEGPKEFEPEEFGPETLAPERFASEARASEEISVEASEQPPALLWETDHLPVDLSVSEPNAADDDFSELLNSVTSDLEAQGTLSLDSLDATAEWPTDLAEAAPDIDESLAVAPEAEVAFLTEPIELDLLDDLSPDLSPADPASVDSSLTPAEETLAEEPPADLTTEPDAQPETQTVEGMPVFTWEAFDLTPAASWPFESEVAEAASTEANWEAAGLEQGNLSEIELEQVEPSEPNSAASRSDMEPTAENTPEAANVDLTAAAVDSDAIFSDLEALLEAPPSAQESLDLSLMQDTDNAGILPLSSLIAETDLPWVEASAGASTADTEPAAVEAAEPERDFGPEAGLPEAAPKLTSFDPDFDPEDHAAANASFDLGLSEQDEVLNPFADDSAAIAAQPELLGPELLSLEEAPSLAKPELDNQPDREAEDSRAELESWPPANVNPEATDAEQAAWFLGLDVGTTGLSAVLLNQNAGQVYPLYWVDNTVSGVTADKFFRLPAIASLAIAPTEQDSWRLQSVGSSALAVTWDDAEDLAEGENDSASVLLKALKPLLKLGVPHRANDSEEPQVQWSETTLVPLSAVQAGMQALLATLTSASAQSPLSAGAVGLAGAEIAAALRQLQGVIVSYPANWPDTYSFNLREAILAAGLASTPDQIYFIEDAIAAVLSGLPNPAGPAPVDSTQPLNQQTLYACNWSAGTVVISAGASLSELGVVYLPRPLSQLTYQDFGLHSMAYGGDAIDLDIIAHLLQPAERRQPRSRQASSDAAGESGWGWQADLPELAQAQWTDLALETLEMPRIAEPDLALRARLQQRLESSLLGQSALEAARHLKLILQHQNQFELQLADQRWIVRRKDLENRIVLPYIQRLNGHLNRLMSQAGLAAQGINQVVCTGGTASLPAITRWLRQKFPNATIIQDTYPNNRPPSCSRVAYGLVNLVRYPQVLDLTRHQYSDTFLLMELIHTFPDQPMPLNGILHLLEQRGINTQACEMHLIALLEGRLPPGLVPTASDMPPLSPRSLEADSVQGLSQRPLFVRQNGQIYVPNAEQSQRLLTYLAALLADKQQQLTEPLLAQLNPIAVS